MGHQNDVSVDVALVNTPTEPPNASLQPDLMASPGSTPHELGLLLLATDWAVLPAQNALV